MTEKESYYEAFMRLLIEEDSAVKVYVRRLVPTWHDVEEAVLTESDILLNTGL